MTEHTLEWQIERLTKLLEEVLRKAEQPRKDTDRPPPGPGNPHFLVIQPATDLISGYYDTLGVRQKAIFSEAFFKGIATAFRESAAALPPGTAIT